MYDLSMKKRGPTGDNRTLTIRLSSRFGGSVLRLEVGCRRKEEAKVMASAATAKVTTAAATRGVKETIVDVVAVGWVGLERRGGVVFDELSPTPTPLIYTLEPMQVVVDFAFGRV
jgi:hypothetical protein